jgi:hypothetical protein
MVDYEALLQHEAMEINIITFLVDYTIIGDNDLWSLNLISVLKT